MYVQIERHEKVQPKQLDERQILYGSKSDIICVSTPYLGTMLQFLKWFRKKMKKKVAILTRITSI
jgi:hypothetical protein